MKAFPQSQFRGDEPVDTAEHGGMDLCDYFASHAMQALLTDPDNVQNVESEGFQDIAWFSYKVADAMMKERQEMMRAREEKK